MKYLLSVLTVLLVGGLAVGAFARAEPQTKEKNKKEITTAKEKGEDEGKESAESGEAIPSGAAKVTLQEAIQTALGRVPGSVQEAQLEEDDGPLHYEVAIVGPDHARTEVRVDAQSGQILKVGKGEIEEEHEEENEG
ncbi:MAG: PepSY domain-containing protein [Nitrospirae bacterium]|nr:PepSY domain-containing protein [Candidatus Manganitrophaceae bacterium]